MRSLRRRSLSGARRATGLLLLALVAAGTHPRTWAAEAPPFEETLARALTEAPRIQRAESLIGAATLRRQAATALPPTEASVGLSSSEDDHGGGRQIATGLEFRQALPFPGKRAARARSATAELLTVEAETSALHREITRTIASLYGRLYSIHEEETALSAARELLLSMAEDAGTRHAAMGGDLAAVARAEVEISHLDERLLDLTRDRALVAAEFDRYLLDPQAADAWQVSSLPRVDLDPDSIVARAVRNSPDVRIAHALRLSAIRRHSAARLESKPDFLLGAGVTKPEGLGPEISASFGLSLPLFSKPALEADATDREREGEDAALRAALAEAHAEGEALAAQWRWAEAQIALHRERILPQDTNTLELSRASYVTGMAEFSAVLDAFRAWLDDRAHLAAIEADRFTAWAEIVFITAESPDGGSIPQE